MCTWHLCCFASHFVDLAFNEPHLVGESGAPGGGVRVVGVVGVVEVVEAQTSKSNVRHEI